MVLLVDGTIIRPEGAVVNGHPHERLLVLLFAKGFLNLRVAPGAVYHASRLKLRRLFSRLGDDELVVHEGV